MENSKALALVSGVVVLDQLLKQWALHLAEPITIIPGVFSLALATNTGSAFGILQNQNLLLAILSFLVIGLLGYYYFRGDGSLSRPGLLLVAAGAFGNLIDRIFLGHVVDFVDFSFWPAFNLADSAITLGIAVLILNLWRKP